MDLSLLWLLLIFALGAYVQTTTGFAFGLIVMSCGGALALAPIEVLAFTVSVLSLMSALTGLYGGLWRQADFKNIALFMLSSLPMIWLGVYWLNHIGQAQLHWLQMLLGASIILSCVISLMKRVTLAHLSPRWHYFVCGGLAGVLGGLFSTSGPPISYLMYRQPVSLAVIRATLLSVFILSSIFRIVTVSLSGQVSEQMLWLCLVGFPIVLATTLLAKRYPPRVEPDTIKRGAMVILLLTGISLVLRAL